MNPLANVKKIFMPTSIGNKIKEFGEKKYGSIKNLAENLGMSLQNLSQYINDKFKPGTILLRRLKKAGCDLNWLYSDEQEYSPVVKERVEQYGTSFIKVDINDLLERIDYLHKDIKRDNILFGKMKDDSLIQKYNEIVFIINQLTLLMYDMDSDLRNAIVMSDNSKLKSKTISLLKEFMELRQLYFNNIT